MSDCVDDLHLAEIDGVITPQPWMQWRHIKSIEVPTKTGSYGVTTTSGKASGILPGLGGLGGIDLFGTLSGVFGSLFGSLPGLFGTASPLSVLPGTASAAGNKNDLLHSLQVGWVNDTPIDQWVYGMITRGGCRVSLQARSRGGLALSSGWKLAAGDAGTLAVASMVGCGADMARAGTLTTGTTFGVIEERMNSVSFPLAPERAGWAKVVPGGSITARVELRFISEFWETGTIDGGASGSESSYETGGTRLDLFAVPVI